MTARKVRAEDVAPQSQARTEALGWLLAACRHWLDTRAGRSSSPVWRPTDLTDWRVLTHLAYLHNLGPLLHRVVSDAPRAADAVPASARQAWDQAYHLNYLFNRRVLDTLSTIVSACAVQGLPVVVFKGPATVARAYEDLALRVMGDVDLLCREADLPALARIARSEGYQRVGETSIYHLEFYHGDLQAGLELHFELYDCMENRQSLLDQALQSRESVRLDDTEFPVPSREIDLVLDLGHLINHDFELTLKHYLDFTAKVMAFERTTAPRGLHALLLATDLAREFGMTVDVVSTLFNRPLGRLEAPSSDADEVAMRVAALRDFLASVDRYTHRAALGDTGHRAGFGRQARNVGRLLFPALAHLQALHGTPTRLGALRYVPGHVAQTIGRGLTNIRRPEAPVSPLAPVSVKRAVYRRRASG